MKIYRLLKETPELKVGALLFESAEHDDFSTKEKEFMKKEDQEKVMFTRKTVEEQPDWFEQVEPFLVPNRLKDKLENFVETLK